MRNLSIVILARNEEHNFEELLTTLNFGKEIIVINDNSTDQTVAIAKKFKANVYTRALNANFSQQRQYGLDKAQNDWVLFIDADERLTPELKKWLLGFEPEQKAGSFCFKRVDWLYNKPLLHGETANTYVTRLVNKNAGKFVRPVHEVWQNSLANKKLNLVINHYPHQSIKQFLEHVNFYSTINAKYFAQTHKKPSISDTVFTPFFKFIYTYIFRLGFLDGANGFIYSFMMSFHSFLSRAKLFVQKAR